MKPLLSLVLLSLSTALAQQPAASVVGSWAITGDIQGFPVEESCSFTQTGDTVSGTCMMSGQKSYPATVKVDGAKVVIVHGGEYDGQALTLTYTATINDKGELAAGKISVSPLGAEGTFTGKKADAKP